MKLDKLIEKACDLLWPVRCIVCDNAMKRSRICICNECRDKLRKISGKRCIRCSRRVVDDSEYCPDCKRLYHSFDGGRFVFSYLTIGESVFRFKYQNRAEYARSFAELIYDELREWIEFINPDALIAVPLHRKRENKRGYNQAEELSREISLLSGVPERSDLIKRSRNTIAQKTFGRKQRQINVKKAFIVRENDVKLDTVIVVDDIFTTGSTIDAVSKELKQHGVKFVYFITITAAGT